MRVFPLTVSRQVKIDLDTCTDELFDTNLRHLALNFQVKFN